MGKGGVTAAPITAAPITAAPVTAAPLQKPVLKKTKDLIDSLPENTLYSFYRKLGDSGPV